MALDNDTAARASTGLDLLLAEDNRINQRFALALLNKAGHRVDIVDNGLKAVDAVRHTEYDAVLMDIQMPELGGIEATAQIRALPPTSCDVYIIAMTADAMSGAKEEYLAAGMDDYISKPVDANLLLSKLGGSCRKRKTPRGQGTIGHVQPDNISSRRVLLTPLHPPRPYLISTNWQFWRACFLFRMLRASSRFSCLKSMVIWHASIRTDPKATSTLWRARRMTW